MRLNKCVLLLMLAMLLLLMPIGAMAAEGGNLLVNGSFDSLDADGLPTGWYVEAYINREGVTLYQSTPDGRSAAAAVVENVGMNDARFAQRVKVQPDTVYRLSGWIRADGIADTGRGANLSVSGVYAFSDSVFDSQGEWVFVETYGLTGPEQKEVIVYARVGGYSGESMGRAAFDDLTLDKVEKVPAGVMPQNWFQKPVEPVIDAGVDTETDTSPEANAFWPELLLISAVYAVLAYTAMRWMQRDRVSAARAELADKHASGMPVYTLVCLMAAAFARLMVALLVEGYEVDVNCFSAWGSTMANVGPTLFYQSNWCDYTPGYIYVMGFNGLLDRVLANYVNVAFVHKLVPMACDMAGAWLVYRLARENDYDRQQASLLCLLVAFNPAIFLNSAAWCQIDSVLCFGLMLVAYTAIHRKWHLVLPLYVICILVKPQALMLGFLGLAAIVMELIHNKESRKQMGVGLLLSIAVALVIILPFCPNQKSADWLITLYGDTLASYPHATVNTANLYYLLGANWQSIVHDAHTGAIVFFMIVSAAWALYSFLRRKDRKLTVLEPVMTALLVLFVVTAALGVMPLLNGEIPFAERLEDAYLLTTGGPWKVSYDQTAQAWQRTFAPATANSWYTEIMPATLLIVSVVLLGACAILGYVLVRLKRMGARDDVHTGLVEPVIMVLFALTFALMLVFDVSWTELGIVAMAMAFAVVLPMFIRSGNLKHLPLCGAVIFLMLFVLGIKMHERYLFPAIFLLAMAYAIRRDRRVLLLLIGLSCTLFINEGIILDNSIRLGRNLGHLNNDTVTLANLLACINVALTLFAVWVCHRICEEDAPVRLSEKLGPPLLPVRVHENPTCHPLDYKTGDKVRFTRVDVLLMAIVTLVYSVVTLTTLGSTRAPQNPWKSSTYEEQVVIDLGQHYEGFSMLYYCQVSYDDFSVSVSVDGDSWSGEYWAQMAEGQCFRWKYLVPSYMTGDTLQYTSPATFDGVQKLSGRFVMINPHQIGLIINELIFRDADGNIIPATVVGSIGGNPASTLYSAPENLLDEQNTMDGEPSWWNGTYFDEIYHARTAFEHLNGTAPYETSHPPLGKVLMSWCVAILGMTPFGWRFAGALCGILMLPVMYMLAKQLTRRRDMAFTAMMLMALDCMHFTQTRIATIDSFPVLFIMLSYLFMLRFMQRDIVTEPLKKLLPDLAFSGFFMGCGIASKWIGVYAGVGLAVLYFWTCLRHLRIGMDAARVLRRANKLTKKESVALNGRDKPAMKRVIVLCLWCLLFFVLVPVIIYLLSYIPYFAFRKLDSLGTYIREVINAQLGMFSYHSTPGMGMDHPFYSPWYEWPLMQRPMYYASPAFVPEGWSYAIFCFGNPAVWYAGLVGMGYTLYRWIRQHRYAISGKEGTFRLFADTWDQNAAFLLISVLAQFLPWVLVPRGTYIYHYFASVPFLILAAVYMIGCLKGENSRGSKVMIIVLLSVSLVMFILLFPYASGVLTPNGWMDFISDYPWTPYSVYAGESSLLQSFFELLQRIPIFPHVYH